MGRRANGLLLAAIRVAAVFWFTKGIEHPDSSIAANGTQKRRVRRLTNGGVT